MAQVRGQTWTRCWFNFDVGWLYRNFPWSALEFIFKILSEEEEEDDYGGWGAEGYEGSVEATYGSVAAAPTVPVAGAEYDAPKSLPNIAPPAGAPPAMAPAQMAPPPAFPAPSAPSPDLGAADSAPPVPAAGLPEGWTMDQWNVYGQMWLEQNGQA